MLGYHALPSLLKTLNSDDAKLGLLRNSAWTLSNFCRGKPPPNFAIVSAARAGQATLGRLIRRRGIESTFSLGKEDQSTLHGAQRQ